MESMIQNFLQIVKTMFVCHLHEAYFIGFRIKTSAGSRNSSFAGKKVDRNHCFLNAPVSSRVEFVKVKACCERCVIFGVKSAHVRPCTPHIKADFAQTQFYHLLGVTHTVCIKKFRNLVFHLEVDISLLNKTSIH